MENVVTVSYDTVTQGFELRWTDADGNPTWSEIGVGIGPLSRALVKATLGSWVDSTDAIWKEVFNGRASQTFRPDRSE